VKRGMLCLLLLSGCLNSSDSPAVSEYALTWTCLSPDGCERTAEIERIDRMKLVQSDCDFTSTQDETFAADAALIFSGLLPRQCWWLTYFSLFGHELEQSMLCFGPGGFELQLVIPNADPVTSSLWLVEGRDADLL
jgi:hypothetical protein